jgi:hypothetical protein
MPNVINRHANLAFFFSRLQLSSQLRPAKERKNSCVLHLTVSIQAFAMASKMPTVVVYVVMLAILFCNGEYKR